MKRAILSLALWSLFAASFTMGAPLAQAAPNEGPMLQGASPEIIHFSDLGVPERSMTGPYDFMSVGFRVPLDWQMTEGAQLVLNFETFFGAAGLAPVEGESIAYGGSIEVSFNGALLTTVLLDDLGEQSVSLDIPVEVLAAVAPGDKHSLSLFLDAALDCQYSRQTTVVVHPSSNFLLPHISQPVVSDLTQLPLPYFQNTFVPDTALLIVPDEPSDADLQAAMSVAAGFGRLTGTDLALSLRTVSALSEQELLVNHLIVVGNASRLPFLGELDLPAAFNGRGFDGVEAGAEDGVVQSVTSPWNNAKGILVVSGNSDPGVVKAAHAVSSGTVRVGNRLDLALVADTNPTFEPEFTGTVATDRTFANLGYRAATLAKIGASSTSYVFYIPSGQTATGEAYVDIYYNHSDLLNFDRSGLLVLLNGRTIGSTRFSEETTEDGRLHVLIRPSELRPGRNVLTVQADLVPYISCTFLAGGNRGLLLDPRLAATWATVWPESLMHLPLTEAGPDDVRRLDLSLYPAPFNESQALNEIAFVLPRADPVAWDVAAQLAADLGDRTDGGAIAAPRVVFGDQVPEDVRANYDLIMVGKPSGLPVVAELSEWLPAPFEPGSDVATERYARVIYRVPPGANVGYLELIASPWNEHRAILGVFGSTEQGVWSAGSALVTGSLRSQLFGNIGVVSGQQVAADDTRGLPSGSGVLATAVPGGETSPLPEPVGPAPVYQRPVWILPALGVTVLLMLGVLAAVIFGSRPGAGARPDKRAEGTRGPLAP